MKRRLFLGFLGGTAAVTTAYAIAPKQISQAPAIPPVRLPVLGQEQTFVEDVFETPPWSSMLQSSALPAVRGTRLVIKRWTGKRWDEVKELKPLEGRRIW